MQLWDFDMIQGCTCGSDYRMTGRDGTDVGVRAGYDCSLRTCRTGDFPEVGGEFEIQTVSCDASSGTFTVTFREQVTAAISYDASAATIETALEVLTSISNATVTLGDSQTTACSGTFAVTFHGELGNVPDLVVDSASLTLNSAVSLATTQEGTKDNIECSGLGACNTATGICTCSAGQVTSDGNGLRGTRGDCGAPDALA
jgi:hypothetical protein